MCILFSLIFSWTAAVHARANHPRFIVGCNFGRRRRGRAPVVPPCGYVSGAVDRPSPLEHGTYLEKSKFEMTESHLWPRTEQCLTCPHYLFTFVYTLFGMIRRNPGCISIYPWEDRIVFPDGNVYFYSEGGCALDVFRNDSGSVQLSRYLHVGFQSKIAHRTEWTIKWQHSTCQAFGSGNLNLEEINIRRPSQKRDRPSRNRCGRYRDSPETPDPDVDPRGLEFYWESVSTETLSEQWHWSVWYKLLPKNLNVYRLVCTKNSK